VVVVRRATGRNQGDVSADYGISGVISGSAAPAALRHPSDMCYLRTQAIVQEESSLFGIVTLLGQLLEQMA
jgi:hypothetical protein